MNLEIYSPIVRLTNVGATSGNFEEYADYGELTYGDSPILREFFNDDDVQEITIVSSNIGFIKTFRKFYKEQHEEVSALIGIEFARYKS